MQATAKLRRSRVACVTVLPEEELLDNEWKSTIVTKCVSAGKPGLSSKLTTINP